MKRFMAMLAAIVLCAGGAAPAATVAIPISGIGPAQATGPWPDGRIFPRVWDGASLGRAASQRSVDGLVRLLAERSRILAFYSGRVPGAVRNGRPDMVRWRHPDVALFQDRRNRWIGAVETGRADRGPRDGPGAATAPRKVAGVLGANPVTPVPLQSAAGYLFGGLVLIGAAGRWRRSRR